MQRSIGFLDCLPGPSRILPHRQPKALSRSACAYSRSPSTSSTYPTTARWISSRRYATLRDAGGTESTQVRVAVDNVSEEERRAYTRLRPVIDALPEPVDWAAAYGSGVRHQANSDPTGPPPLTDFLLSTPNLEAFHSQNLRFNPSHYPLVPRLLGAKRVARLTERWGAGIWYVTMVNVRGLEAKYGIISTRTLMRDLVKWRTLYVAGRLHKPVLQLQTTPHLDRAQQRNLRSALSLALLLLPPRFTEYALWEQIAGISYSGDPRMSVPGAENPLKVRNIVRGQGAREGMRQMYGSPMPEGVRWELRAREGEGRDAGKHEQAEHRQKTGHFSWRGEGEEYLEQPSSPDYLASLAINLPLPLQLRLLNHFHPDTVPSSAARSLTARSRRTDQWVAVFGESGSSAAKDWRAVVMQEMRRIIARPALTQSIKGLFTAGFRKSLVYSLAKIRKWWKGRRKP